MTPSRRFYILVKKYLTGNTTFTHRVSPSSDIPMRYKNKVFLRYGSFTFADIAETVIRPICSLMGSGRELCMGQGA